MTEPLQQAPQVRQVFAGRAEETVRVIYGVHSLEARIAGRSVDDVRSALRQALNIAPRAVAVVDGREVLDSYILQAGDTLEFVRLAGEKGSENVLAGLGGLFMCRNLSNLPQGPGCGACPGQSHLNGAEREE